MSTRSQPKQLIPFLGGKSLLAVAMERLRGLVPAENICICAGEEHRGAILAAAPGFPPGNFVGEPMGRDTLNAVALGTGVIGRTDTDAVIAVFTADHLIEPINEFQRIVEKGYQVAEAHDPVLVTFGITPTHAATAYGYLELGEVYGGGGAYRVTQFKEKPDAETAQRYLDAGPKKYLWNSGMFVWRNRTLMEAIQKYHPDNFAGIAEIVADWDTPRRDEVLRRVYPALQKVSVDYAVMEPASRDPQFAVAAVPMPLKWLDVGSWPSFAKACAADEHGNVVTGGRHTHVGSRNTIIASSEADHLVATIGLEGVIVIHTAKATLVCAADQAEDIKKLHQLIAEEFGEELL